ncbi:MAG: zinc ribbon domain-containing protein [Fusobacteriaceae bacterium]
MLIYSLVLSVVACVVSLIMAQSFINFGTGILLLVVAFFSSMATTSVTEIFRKRYRGLIPNNKVLEGLMDYGLSASALFFPLILNLIIAGISTMGMRMSYLGMSQTGIFFIQIVWIVTSVIFGITFTVVAYPESEFYTILKITDKIKNQIKNKTTDTKKNCSYCNGKVEESAKFCPHCGKENI